MSKATYLLLAAGLLAILIAAVQPYVTPATPHNEYMQKFGRYAEPGSAEARPYCPNPGGAFMRGTGCPPRVPTVPLPLCPFPD